MRQTYSIDVLIYQKFIADDGAASEGAASEVDAPAASLGFPVSTAGGAASWNQGGGSPRGSLSEGFGRFAPPSLSSERFFFSGAKALGAQVPAFVDGSIG